MNDVFNSKGFSTYKLRLRQNLDLNTKILLSQQRIKQWYDYYSGKVYVAFSGGKDSTVLLHLIRKLSGYSDVPAVFCDTGLEYPEVRGFVKTIDNVEWIKPKMHFKDVIEKYGYPLVSKEQAQFIQQYRNAKSQKTKNTRLFGNKYGRGKIANQWLPLLNAPFMVSEKCCDIMKKEPSKKYEKQSGRKPFIGTMASESCLRTQKYNKEGGCNAYTNKRPTSTPLAFWYDKDIWEYIEKFNVAYSDIYKMGYDRTGCMFCGFGCHLNNPNRFQKMSQTHPKQWKYCMEKLGMSKVLDYIGINYQSNQLEFDLEDI